MNDVMHRKRARRIFAIWEKSESWVPASERRSWVFASEEEGWLSVLAEALRRVPHLVWGRWKSQHRKFVYLSPFNSKVIKSFLPELRSRKCFLCFGIPMLSIYMSYEHSLSISHIPIMGMLHCNLTQKILCQLDWDYRIQRLNLYRVS